MDMMDQSQTYSGDCTLVMDARSQSSHMCYCRVSQIILMVSVVFACYQLCLWHCRLLGTAIKPRLLVGIFHVESNSRAMLAQEYLVVAIAATALELRRSVILVWVVLVSVHAPDIMLVVHVAGIFLGLVVSTLAVVSVHAWYHVSSLFCKLARQHCIPLVSASLSTSPPTNPARSSLAKAWFTTLPVALSVGRGQRCRYGQASLLTLFALVVLVELESLKSSTTGY